MKGGDILARKKVNVNPIVGERIKCIRTDKKMSQLELANLLGYDSGNTVLYWENGRSSVPADVLDQLSDIFNVSIYYLLGKTETMVRWEKFDSEKIEDLKSEIKKLSEFENFFRSVGFSFLIIPDEESATFNISKDSQSIDLSLFELEDFKESIINIASYEFSKLLKSKK